MQDDDTAFLTEAREGAELWARDLLKSTDWVILDTETTGLQGSEVVQIGILSAQGRVLLDALVKPTGAITAGAQAIHHISAEDVASAVTFPVLYPVLAALVQGKRVIIYNAEFDNGIIAGECHRHELPSWPFASTECVMLEYSAWCNDWDDYHEDFRWQKLPGGNHTAIEDCRAVWRLIKRMAGQTEPSPLLSPQEIQATFDALGAPELPF